MKTRITTLFCVMAICLAEAANSPSENKPNPKTPAKVVDAVIVRPISLGATVVGGALFVLSLPVTAALKTTKPAADALVVKPAWATFKRPLGDMDAMAD